MTKINEFTASVVDMIRLVVSSYVTTVEEAKDTKLIDIRYNRFPSKKVELVVEWCVGTNVRENRIDIHTTDDLVKDYVKVALRGYFATIVTEKKNQLKITMLTDKKARLERAIRDVETDIIAYNKDNEEIKNVNFLIKNGEVNYNKETN